MNNTQILDGLERAVKLSAVCVRIIQLIQYNEEVHEFQIATDTIRAVMELAMDETTTPNKYDRNEFKQFLNRVI